MNWRDRITVDPKVLVGKPVIKGAEKGTQLESITSCVPVSSPATWPSHDHRDARTEVMAIVSAFARGTVPIFPTDSPGASRYALARPSA